MSIREWQDINRRESKKIMVGNVPIGGGSPIAVQTMTNAPSADVRKTLEQIDACFKVGVDIVRVSCPDEDSTKALKQIVKQSPVPIIADIHFHYKRAIEAAAAGAHCLRINPGNIGDRNKILEVVRAAKDNNCSIRIGVNAGSLEKHILDKYHEPSPEALVASALENIKILEDADFTNFKIAVKASDVFLSIKAYTHLAKLCDYPLHVGITESGTLSAGTVKSSIGIGNLLMAGIGDTIRVSLSSDPVDEVKVGFNILKSLGIRTRGINIISCPSCARQAFDVIKVVQVLEQRLEHITAPITLSILGCIVNGIGEARETDIGFIGGGNQTHQVYINGLSSHRLKNEDIIEHVVNLVEQKSKQLSIDNLKN